MDNKDFGKKGEEIAKHYLVKEGYSILHANWQFGHKEIDLITEKGDQIIFVEVKTRNFDHFEDKKDAVPRKKQRHIIDAANAYIEKYDIELEARFDIIFVVLNNNNPEIEHIEEAFYPIVR